MVAAIVMVMMAMMVTMFREGVELLVYTLPV